MSHAAPLEHWHEFYLLLGTAAAALVALLFVAISLGVGFLGAEDAGATRSYVSPVVAHYTGVLYASLVALAPSQTTTSLAFLIGLPSLVGLLYGAVIVVRIFRHTSDLPDRLGYGFGPFVCYGGGLIAAGLFFVGHARAPDVLAAALVLLLSINIRNAWDLALTFVRRHSGDREKK